MENFITDINDLRDKLVECLALVNQIDARMDAERAHTTLKNTHLPVHDPEDSSQSAEEVKKVARRLPRWGRNSEQYNTRILNAFLAFRRENRKPITQKELSATLGNPDWFYRNFNQMINFGAKNHGKVFDRNGVFVEIWEPVQHLVAEYEATFS